MYCGSLSRSLVLSFFRSSVVSLTLFPTDNGLGLGCKTAGMLTLLELPVRTALNFELDLSGSMRYYLDIQAVIFGSSKKNRVQCGYPDRWMKQDFSGLKLISFFQELPFV